MNQFKTIMATTLIIAAVSSFKKNNDMMPLPVSIGSKLSTMEYPAAGTADTYTYNADRSLATVKEGGFTLNYKYAAAPFGCEVLSSSNIIDNDIGDIVFASNNLTGFIARYYNNGVITGGHTTNAQ